MFDTIAAIATPKGEGGIGIVKISGNEALSIISKIFKSKANKNILNAASFSIHYGEITDSKNIIDEVLVNIFRAPNTYTKENIVEINCHGGYIITKNILELVLKSGARLAEPGEFTRRAFLNGRIDLTQAEAVMDVIHSKTEKGATLSLDQLRGDLKEKISDLKTALLDITAHVNVVLDYPEEGIDTPIPKELLENLKNTRSKINNLISSYKQGKLIKNGLKTTIIGKPNVGKSSLLNYILKEERAIVTNIEGTTRDTIEEVVNLNGIPLVITDTAGIRKTDNIVENIGIEKSKNMIKESDLILFLLDASKEITEEDIEIYNQLDEKNTIGIINKIDINTDINTDMFKKIKSWIKISITNKIGLSELEKRIEDLILKNNIQDSSEKFVLTNIRHKTALEKTKQAIDNIFETLNMELPMDLIAIDLKEGLDALSEITGEITSEDLLDHIFSNFCVGK